MIRYIYGFGALAIFLLPSIVLGQGFLQGNRTAIELSTQYPEPNQPIEATVLNQNSSQLPGDLVWRVNGSVESSYTNKRTIQLTTSDLGEPTVVQVLKNGTVLAQQVVNPVYIDIIVDPLTYTPESYPGRAEVTPGSTVLLTALTEEITKRNPSAYTYTWEVNGKVIEGGAWDGNYRIQAPVPVGGNTMDVTVSISRPGIGKVGEGHIEIPVRDTVTEFYRISQLYGRNSQALPETYLLQADTLTVRAVPYFMANEAIMQSKDTEWRVDGRDVQPDSPFTITIQPNRSRGQSNLSFKQFNTDNFSQQAQQTIQITY